MFPLYRPILKRIYFYCFDLGIRGFSDKSKLTKTLPASVFWSFSDLSENTEYYLYHFQVDHPQFPHSNFPKSSMCGRRGDGYIFQVGESTKTGSLTWRASPGHGRTALQPAALEATSPHTQLQIKLTVVTCLRHSVFTGIGMRTDGKLCAITARIDLHKAVVPSPFCCSV